MSMNFNAHQYDAAFRPKRLQNWEVPKIFAEPCRQGECYPQFVANQKGHLFPEYKRCKRHPFCTYIGTYQLPRRITKDLAIKLSQFPRRHYSVIKDTTYAPCKMARKCDGTKNQQELRTRVRKCIEENIDENVKQDISKLKDESFFKKVRDCIDTNNQTTDDSDKNRLLRRLVRDCIEENTNGNTENINKETLLKSVKECLAQKQAENANNADKIDNIRKIVNDCLENQLKSKENKQELKDGVAENLEHRKIPQTPSRDDDTKQDFKPLKKDDSEKGENLRKIVKECMKEIDVNETDSLKMKQKVKACVKNRLHQKEGIDQDKENELRQRTKQCITKMVSEEGIPSTESRKQMFKQKVKKCVQGQGDHDGTDKLNMREAVKHCLEQYKPSDIKLDKAELKDKIKRCARDRLNFRQAVKECIPAHIGEQNFRGKVKECAKEKVKQKTKKEEFRRAVQDCIKDTEKERNNIQESEFKQVVKDCALKKLKKN